MTPKRSTISSNAIRIILDDRNQPKDIMAHDATIWYSNKNTGIPFKRTFGRYKYDFMWEFVRKSPEWECIVNFVGIEEYVRVSNGRI